MYYISVSGTGSASHKYRPYILFCTSVISHTSIATCTCNVTWLHNAWNSHSTVLQLIQYAQSHAIESRSQVLIYCIHWPYFHYNAISSIYSNPHPDICYTMNRLCGPHVLCFGTHVCCQKLWVAFRIISHYAWLNMWWY